MGDWGEEDLWVFVWKIAVCSIIPMDLFYNF